MTLPFLLGPVPWSLSTPHKISTKTDQSKLQHGLQSHIEPTLDWSCSVAHNVDFNAVTTEHNSFSCHLHGSDGTSIQPGLVRQGMLVLSLIHIYNVKAAVYKVLQTFSQRITWVFCSTMVYATKCAPSECQQHWPEYGGRALQSYTVKQIVTLPMCKYHGKVIPIKLIENPSPTSSSTF